MNTESKRQAALQATAQADWPAAIAAFREVSAQSPGDRDALFGLANAEFRGGDRAAAARSLTKLAESGELSPDAEHLAGVLALASGDVKTAHQAFKRVLTREPAHFATLNDLGSLFGRSGDFASARACFEQASALRPDAAGPRYNLGVALRMLGQPELAYRQLERAADASPNHPHVHHQLGDLAHQAGRDETPASTISVT